MSAFDMCPKCNAFVAHNKGCPLAGLPVAPTPPSVASDADRERREKAARISADPSGWSDKDYYAQHEDYIDGFLDGAESEAAHSDAYWEERCRGLVEALDAAGGWMSACLSDPLACAEIKRDYNAVLKAIAPFRAGGKLPPSEK